MGTRRSFPYKTSFLVQTVRPTDVIAQNTLDFTSDGATASLKLYDPAVDEVLSSLESQPQTVWSVTNAGLFVIGDIVELTQNDATILTGTLTAVNATAGTLTSDAATTVDAAAGNRVRKRLGAAITMTEYGTPVLGKDDWGFRGVIPSNHPGLVLDLEFDVEISFVGTGGGGLDLLQRREYIVKNPGAC